MSDLPPYQDGWRDDGSAGGIARVDPIGRRVVRYPIMPAQAPSQFGPGGTFTFLPAVFVENPDGTGRAYRLGTTTTLGSFARIWFAFRGSLLGVTFSKAAVTTALEASVRVDGEFVALDLANDLLANRGIPNTTFVDATASVITHRDLDPDVQHYGSIELTGDTTSARTLQLYGFLLDADAGYEAPPRAAQLLAAAATPTADTSLTMVGAAGERAAVAVTHIDYANTTAGPITVTIRSLVTTGVVIGQVVVPANGMATWAPAHPVALNGPSHIAGAAGVNHAIWGIR